MAKAVNTVRATSQITRAGTGLLSSVSPPKVSPSHRASAFSKVGRSLNVTSGSLKVQAIALSPVFCAGLFHVQHEVDQRTYLTVGRISRHVWRCIPLAGAVGIILFIPFGIVDLLPAGIDHSPEVVKARHDGMRLNQPGVEEMQHHPFPGGIA